MLEIYWPLIFALLSTENAGKKAEKGEFSSAGSEHLPYKQRVGGSNPSTPQKSRVGAFLLQLRNKAAKTDVSVAQLVEQLTLNQRVRSSSLRGDTNKKTSTVVVFFV